MLRELGLRENYPELLHRFRDSFTKLIKFPILEEQKYSENKITQKIVNCSIKTCPWDLELALCHYVVLNWSNVKETETHNRL